MSGSSQPRLLITACGPEGPPQRQLHGVLDSPCSRLAGHHLQHLLHAAVPNIKVKEHVSGSYAPPQALDHYVQAW
jgi:hypothetical protein